MEKLYLSNPSSFPLVQTQDLLKRFAQFSDTGKMYYNTGNGISREEFAKGYAVYAFDLIPDMCSSSPHFNLVQKGNLSIDIQFSAAPTEAVSLVCYGEFESLIQIDSDRNVFYD